MYDIAPAVSAWLEDGTPVTLIRLVQASGISARWPGAAVALRASDRAGSLQAGDRAGSLLAGALDDQLPALGPGLATLTVSDQRAASVGLSCGGRAEVLVQDAGTVPAQAWQRLLARRPVTLVTALDTGRTRIGEDDPTPTTRVAVTDGALVAAYRPVTRLRVVGAGLIADALAAIAAVLGWELSADRLGRSDAVVVLSHDESEDVPALADAIESGVGYVGALGSRHTQARRAAQLAERGLSTSRIHGPAGLDLGSSTPAEIALAILSEALAVLRGAPAGSLRERPGPVHR